MIRANTSVYLRLRHHHRRTAPTKLRPRHPRLRTDLNAHEVERQQLNITLLYNRIGKRIIGVGRSEGSSGSEDNARVPDSYEMPRDVFDLTLSKRFGEHLEIKANVRDLLAQKVSYKQFVEVPSANGTTREVEQITRQYKPGRNFGLSATYSF